MGVGHPWASTSLQRPANGAARVGGAGGLAHTPNPAYFLLPHCPPTPCMMGKAILPLPPPLLLLPVWEGGGEVGAAAPHPSFLLICTHWPLQMHTTGAQPLLAAAPHPVGGRDGLAQFGAGGSGTHSDPQQRLPSFLWLDLGSPLPVMHSCPSPTLPSLTSLGSWPPRKGPVQPRLSSHK